jgi:membrane fusion protein (multidrug efflux system)
VIAQAEAQANAAKRAVVARRAVVAEAQTGVDAAKQGITAAEAKNRQALARLQESRTAPKRVGLSEAVRRSALARVQQAAAALEAARVALDRTRIRTPIDGVVSRRSAQLGQQVAPGQPLMAVIPDERPWVVANFKETQLGELRSGEPVEIHVDAIPGVVYHGHVQSISQGTGATFALLPADNATGNFTKVVQRVPVKITLDDGQSNLDKLRAGLSSTVAVILRGR